MGLLCPLPQAFSLSLLMERDPHGRICRLSQRRLPQQNASDRRLKPQTFVSHSRGVWKSQVRVPAGPVSAAGSPSGLETATFPASSRVGGERGTQLPSRARTIARLQLHYHPSTKASKYCRTRGSAFSPNRPWPPPASQTGPSLWAAAIPASAQSATLGQPAHPGASQGELHGPRPGLAHP